MKRFICKTIFFFIIMFYTTVLNAEGKEEAKPNIVIIYADDMGYGDLACQNPDSKIPTPNLDKLASQGLRLSDAHSSSGICTPSRYGLLTGRYHWRKFHDIVHSFGPSMFDKDETTIPLLLKGANYKTACIGKWHLGWDWESIMVPGAEPVQPDGTKWSYYLPEAFDWSKRIPDGPTAHGFDYYFGDSVINFPPYTWIENDKVLIVPTENLNIDGYETAEAGWEFRGGPMAKDWNPYKVLPTLTDTTVSWIAKQKNSEQPFFLYFALPSPHAPIIPNEEYRGKSQAGGFGDYVYETDAMVGKVLKALDDNNLTDNTIVIFTSDNGPEYFAYERVKNFDHSSTAALRGVKRDIWEGGNRIPFIVRWPGKIKEGTVSSALTCQVDIMATLADIVGIEIPTYSGDDSIDQLEVWTDSTNTKQVRDVLMVNTYESAYGIRNGNWIYLDVKNGAGYKMPDWFKEKYNIEGDMPNGGLYDLSVDPKERENLVDKYPEKVKELKELYLRVRAKGQRFTDN